MNIELFFNIDKTVGEAHGYYDEFVYDEILFIVKFALGAAEYTEVKWYIQDIICKLGIIEGQAKDLELINLIKTEEKKELNNPYWIRSVNVLQKVKEYLEKKTKLNSI